MTKELITIRKILEDFEFNFQTEGFTNREELIYMPLNYILDDYLEMYSMLCDIQRILDKMEREAKEDNEL